MEFSDMINSCSSIIEANLSMLFLTWINLLFLSQKQDIEYYVVLPVLLVFFQVYYKGVIPHHHVMRYQPEPHFCMSFYCPYHQVFHPQHPVLWSLPRLPI